MVSAILHARATGEGQVIDAAMTDGSAVLSAMLHTFLHQGLWRDERGVNFIDTGAHFYEVYETADGRHVSIGAIEPQFYRQFLDKLGLADDPDFARQMDATRWPALKERLAAIFRTKTRDAWDAVFEGTDACYAPVLSLTEAPRHPHNAARETFVEVDGVTQPAPAPRYSATACDRPRMPLAATDTRALLSDLGYAPGRIDALLASGKVV